MTQAADRVVSLSGAEMPEVTVAAADIPEASARSLHATVSSLNAHVASPLRMCVCARAHTHVHMRAHRHMCSAPRPMRTPARLGHGPL